MTRSVVLISFFLTLLSSLSACSKDPNSPLARQCARELVHTHRVMDRAKAGEHSAIAMAKAGSYLAAAEAQRAIERYKSCVGKARKARAYLKVSGIK